MKIAGGRGDGSCRSEEAKEGRREAGVQGLEWGEEQAHGVSSQ